MRSLFKKFLNIIFGSLIKIKICIKTIENKYKMIDLLIIFISQKVFRVI